MWPQPLHPCFYEMYFYRRQLQPYREQLKSLHFFTQLTQLDPNALSLLTQFERTIVHRHERLIGHHIHHITEGRHRDGLRVLIAASHENASLWPKVSAFCPVGQMPIIKSIQEL